MVTMTNSSNVKIGSGLNDNQKETVLADGVSLDTKGSVQEASKELKATATQIVVHEKEGPYLMDKAKWSTLIIPVDHEGDRDGLGELTQEDTLTKMDDNPNTVEKEGLIQSITKNTPWEVGVV